MAWLLPGPLPPAGLIQVLLPLQATGPDPTSITQNYVHQCESLHLLPAPVNPFQGFCQEPFHPTHHIHDKVIMMPLKLEARPVQWDGECDTPCMAKLSQGADKALWVVHPPLGEIKIKQTPRKSHFQQGLFIQGSHQLPK